jgi:porin
MPAVPFFFVESSLTVSLTINNLRANDNDYHYRCRIKEGLVMRGNRSWRLRGGAAVPAALVALGLMVTPAVAAPVDANSNDGASNDGALDFLTGISRSSNMLGDMWGMRPWLSKAGITFSLQETSEILGNVSGGTRQGFEYDGLTTATLQMDTERAFGWHGGTANVSALQIHGRNLSADNLSSLQTASGIEGDRATRLWEAWYQQKFLDEDSLDLKIGQQSLDQEFMVSQNALYFVNTMFGWPMLPSADMPGGGPAYPLSAPGLRLRAKASDSLTVLAGVFNGAPAPATNTDSQKANGNGLKFPVDGSVLAIAELQYAYPNLNTLVQANETEPLSRTYKIGAWYDSKKFDDQQIDDSGKSLADPNSTGIPQKHQGDYALYGVADQMVWRDFNEPDRTVNVFLRAMGTPDEDRNLVDFSLNAGLTVHEPFLNRDDDTFGLGMGLAHVGSHASALDQDQSTYNGGFYPVRRSETFIEATYQYEVTPWWQLQPDVQYIFNPGAGLQDPNDTSKKIANETIVGIRTNILF